MVDTVQDWNTDPMLNRGIDSGILLASPDDYDQQLINAMYVMMARIKTYSLGSGGFSFPATQVDSADPNTLDDYEEGLWTPEFSAASCTFNHVAQFGEYLKVGRGVWFTCYIGIGTTGNTIVGGTPLSILGLPFVSASPTLPFIVRHVGTTTAYVQMQARVANVGVSLILEGLAAASTSMVGINAGGALSETAGSNYRIAGHYFT